MPLTPTALLDRLNRLPAVDGYWLAYSGGRDSHVLLHLLAQLATSLPAPLHVLHVDHGLQPASGRWAEHCVTVCERLQLRCEVIPLALQPQPGESPEALARDARYQALLARCGSGMLLTAHHRDDQAETVLLQLLRGAGPSGLAAMPALRRRGRGFHARPLLDTAVAAIADYARQHHLQWVEDPSNQSTDFDRNYLRHQVIPRLQARWPALDRTLSRSARHCAEAQQLVEQQAARDLQQLQSAAETGLRLAGLEGLSAVRAHAVLRAWIAGQGLPAPDTVRLDRLRQEMLTAAADRNPLVHWPDVEVRRYRGMIHAMSPLPPLDPELHLSWDGWKPLPLPAGLGRLQVAHGAGGLAIGRWQAGAIEVRFGRPAGRLRVAGRGHSTRFKQFFQQQQIPPWQRARVPMIFIEGELAAVADLCVCEGFDAVGREQGVQIHWQRMQ